MIYCSLKKVSQRLEMISDGNVWLSWFGNVSFLLVLYLQCSPVNFELWATQTANSCIVSDTAFGTYTSLMVSTDICYFHVSLFQQRVAQEVLTTLKEHPDAWTRVDTILEFSQNLQTKYYALQILETVIRARWKVLPRQQCEGKLVCY